MSEVIESNKTKYPIGTVYGSYRIKSKRKSSKGSIFTFECSVCKSLKEVSVVNVKRFITHVGEKGCICSRFKSSLVPEAQPGVHKALDRHDDIPSKIGNVQVKANVSLTNGEFDEKTILKVGVQRDLYNAIVRNGVSGDVLVLAGPSVKRHLEDIRSTFGSDGQLIHIVENNIEVFNRQVQEYKDITGTWTDSVDKVHSLKENVVFTYGEISMLPPYTIVDADFMGSYKTEGGLITSLLSRQVFSNSQLKGFIFTLSERGQSGEGGFEATTKWIEENVFPIIGMKATCRSRVPLVKVKQLIYKYKVLISVEEFGRAIDILMFHYNDQKGPMITCSLVYR